MALTDLTWGSALCYSSPSGVSDCATPWTGAHQGPLSMAFSMQEYWSGLPFPPPGHLPHSGIEPESPCRLHLQADSSHAEPSVNFRPCQTFRLRVPVPWTQDTGCGCNRPPHVGWGGIICPHLWRLPARDVVNVLLLPELHMLQTHNRDFKRAGQGRGPPLTGI